MELASATQEKQRVKLTHAKPILRALTIRQSYAGSGSFAGVGKTNGTVLGKTNGRENKRDSFGENKRDCFELI